MFVKCAWVTLLLATFVIPAHADGTDMVTPAARAPEAPQAPLTQSDAQILNAQLNAYLDGNVLLASTDAVTLGQGAPATGLPFDTAALDSCDALTRFIGSCDYVGQSGADQLLFSALLPDGAPALQGAALSPIDEGVSFIAATVPTPAAGILFGTVLLGAVFIRRRKLQHKLGLPS